MIIAIDGPAGTGKSTVAKIIAQHYGIVFLNSGSFYRAITLALLRAEKDLSNVDDVCNFASELKMEYVNGRVVLNDEDVEDLLHSPEIDLNASKVSSIVPLRDIVNKKLRKIAQRESIVCEGRDMTTVVFPNADYKFYLDASIDVQAMRRFKQGVSNLSYEEVKAQIIQRDKMDKAKIVGALKIAEDATYIDTSDLTIEQVCAIIYNKIHS
ncbi:MAG: (d)CMP kinase [Treponema sp.]|nr:(d)CMP kinase [Treponema sp.]